MEEGEDGGLEGDAVVGPGVVGGDVDAGDLGIVEGGEFFGELLEGLGEAVVGGEDEDGVRASFGARLGISHAVALRMSSRARLSGVHPASGAMPSAARWAAMGVMAAGTRWPSAGRAKPPMLAAEMRAMALTGVSGGSCEATMEATMPPMEWPMRMRWLGSVRNLAALAGLWR